MSLQVILYMQSIIKWNNSQHQNWDWTKET